MAYPTIPIEARADIQENFQEKPVVTELKKGQVKEYKNRNKRNVTSNKLSYSVFVENLTALDTFLKERQGYKPFILPQNNLTYICPKYSINYGATTEKGTIQMDLIRYTN